MSVMILMMVNVANRHTTGDRGVLYFWLSNLTLALLYELCVVTQNAVHSIVVLIDCVVYDSSGRIYSCWSIPTERWTNSKIHKQKKLSKTHFTSPTYTQYQLYIYLSQSTGGRVKSAQKQRPLNHSAADE